MTEKKRMDDPIVSVIMPAYNMERYINQAIASVVAQTMTQWELLIIDDCSTDSTLEIAGTWAERDARIRALCNESNSGVARTRNWGIELARGRYIAFMDSDDVWRPEKLKKQLEKLSVDKADFSYCSYAIIDAFGKQTRADYLVPEHVTLSDQLKENAIQLSSLLICAEALQDIRFTTSFYHEDYVLGLELLQNGYKAAGCTEVLSEWRYIENSRSFNKWRAARNRWKIYRKFLYLPLLKSMNLFIHYAFAGLRKYSRKY